MHFEPEYMYRVDHLVMFSVTLNDFFFLIVLNIFVIIRKNFGQQILDLDSVILQASLIEENIY